MKLQGLAKNGLIKSWETITSAEEPKTPKTPKTLQKMEATVNNGVSDKVEALEALSKLLSPQVPTELIEAEVAKQLAKQKPTRIEIKIAEKKAVNAGRQHKEFETLMHLIANRMNVWMAGPAGSGKTSAASAAAKALELNFYAISVCAQTTESKIFGYMNATGEYVATLFHKAYSEGGVFLIDEIDAGNPNVLAALNAALANGQCAFPCGMVQKHENFILVAAANTVGSGGTMQYVGRNRIDAATLDRFFSLDWGYDEALELDIAPNEKFTKRVQDLRAKATQLKMPVVISPRISIDGGKMVEAGMKESKVLELMLFNKISADQAKALK